MREPHGRDHAETVIGQGVDGGENILGARIIVGGDQHEISPRSVQGTEQIAGLLAHTGRLAGDGVKDADAEIALRDIIARAHIVDADAGCTGMKIKLGRADDVDRRTRLA